MKCTWKDCGFKAKIKQISKAKKSWANLCLKHHTQLDDSLTEGDHKKFMACWVNAQGGANKATKRMTERRE